MNMKISLFSKVKHAAFLFLLILCFNESVYCVEFNVSNSRNVPTYTSHNGKSAKINLTGRDNSSLQLLKEDGFNQSGEMFTPNDYTQRTPFSEIMGPMRSAASADEDDPGFPGDPGNLPIGDGTLFLLFFATLYAVFKYRRTVHQSCN